MGVTVGDFDEDGDFDVYVSNMYSKAGNRIVPLVRKQLTESTYTSLLGLAAGNTLYLQEPGGAYRQAATDLHVDHAGWAWGQAFFDADNDGDRDIFVVNGNTSHSDARAPDY